MKKFNTLLILILFFPVLLFSQDNDSTIILPKANLSGIIKTKLELNLEEGDIRFAVRNARFGTRGSINKYVSYRAEVDLSDEGKIRMLDAYVKLNLVKNLEFYLGQAKVPFGTDYLRNPIQNMFANRSFVSKYVNNGLRDIGLVANYNFDTKIPVELWASVMNGTGGNNPQWIKSPNYSARILVSPFKNWRVAGNFYQGNSLNEKDLLMYGGELRFKTNRLLIEAEYLERSYTDTSLNKIAQDAFLIHSMYSFPVEYKWLHYINPLLRYDYMGKGFREEVSAERITAGVNFGLIKQEFISEIRLNYENYFNEMLPTHFDKFTVEFVVKF